MKHLHDTTDEQKLIEEIGTELIKARKKFPGKNVTFAALIEEIGELATALFEEPRASLRKEAVQVAVMAMRVVLDGDHTFDAWRADHGLDPILSPQSGEIAARKTQEPIDITTPESDYFRELCQRANRANREREIPRRVTPAMVDAEIMDEDYHTFPGSRQTVCALTLRNGFTVTGESACVDPASFDADLGRDLAKGKARQKVFELLAFRIRDELHLERLRAAQENLSPAKTEADALARAVASLNS